MDRTMAAQYVGPAGAGYLGHFQYMAQTGETTYWNPILFLTAPYWFLYRKMYGTGLAWMVLCLLTIGLHPITGLLTALGGRLFFAFWGEDLYKRHIDRLLAEQAALRPEERPDHLQKWGGTAPVLTGVATALYLIVVFLAVLSKMGFLG